MVGTYNLEENSIQVIDQTNTLSLSAKLWRFRKHRSVLGWWYKPHTWFPGVAQTEQLHRYDSNAIKTSTLSFNYQYANQRLMNIQHAQLGYNNSIAAEQRLAGGPSMLAYYKTRALKGKSKVQLEFCKVLHNILLTIWVIQSNSGQQKKRLQREEFHSWVNSEDPLHCVYSRSVQLCIPACVYKDLHLAQQFQQTRLSWVEQEPASHSPIRLPRIHTICPTALRELGFIYPSGSGTHHWAPASSVHAAYVTCWMLSSFMSSCSCNLAYLGIQVFVCCIGVSIDIK